MAVFLHTRVRVSDLDNSINFYCEHLGFKVLSGASARPMVIRLPTSNCRATCTLSS